MIGVERKALSFSAFSRTTSLRLSPEMSIVYIFSGLSGEKTLKNIFLRANASKNYRVPTYNDLYWPGQGNINLIPETAVQSEFAVTYKKNKISADLGVFYISANRFLRNMVRAIVGTLVDVGLGKISKDEFRKSNVRAGNRYFLNYAKVPTYTQNFAEKIAKAAETTTDAAQQLLPCRNRGPFQFQGADLLPLHDP